jgi:hypothetical protein
MGVVEDGCHCVGAGHAVEVTTSLEHRSHRLRRDLGGVGVTDSSFEDQTGTLSDTQFGRAVDDLVAMPIVRPR